MIRNVINVCVTKMTANLSTFLWVFYKITKKLEHGTKIDKNVHVSVKQHYVFGNFLINKKIKIKLTKKKKNLVNNITFELDR